MGHDRQAGFVEAITPDPARVSVVRRLVADHMPASLSEVVPTLELLVSEVLTNVVLHADGLGELRVDVVGSTVRVQAFDHSPVIPSPRRFTLDSSTGRGLGLVETLADAWGVEPTDDG